LVNIRVSASRSDEAAPSNPQTIELLVDEKTHPEVPGKAHKGPKPVWAGQVTEREEQEPNEHGKGPGQVQEAVEFVAHLPPRWPGAYRPSKHECCGYADDHIQDRFFHRGMIRGPAPS
jgi:hypothetical protein